MTGFVFEFDRSTFLAPETRLNLGFSLLGRILERLKLGFLILALFLGQRNDVPDRFSSFFRLDRLALLGRRGILALFPPDEMIDRALVDEILRRDPVRGTADATPPMSD